MTSFVPPRSKNLPSHAQVVHLTNLQVVFLQGLPRQHEHTFTQSATWCHAHPGVS